MTHVDDLYEPNDREPEPCDWYPALEPLDLAEVEDAYKVVFPKVADLGRSGERLVAAIPQLLDELREARQRIAAFEALPTREEWTVTSGQSRPPRSGDLRFTADAAMNLAARDGKQAWRQIVTTKPVAVRPWEPIDSAPPF